MSDFAHVFSPDYVAELQYISPASKESVARAGTIVAGWKRRARAGGSTNSGDGDATLQLGKRKDAEVGARSNGGVGKKRQEGDSGFLTSQG
jgi:hypothetical protein